MTTKRHRKGLQLPVRRVHLKLHLSLRSTTPPSEDEVVCMQEPVIAAVQSQSMEVETSTAVGAATEVDASLAEEEPDFDPMEPEEVPPSPVTVLDDDMDVTADADEEVGKPPRESNADKQNTNDPVYSDHDSTDEETKRRRRQRRFATAAEKASMERVRKDPVLTDTEECPDKDFVFVKDSYSKAAPAGKRWALHKDWRDRGRARINAGTEERMFPKTSTWHATDVS